MDQKPSPLRYLVPVVALVVIAVLIALVLQQQQQIKSLKGTETKTETSQQNSNANSNEASEAPPSGEREVISYPYSQLTGNCGIKANTEAPTTTKLFSDKTLGFEVELPYNENWGTDRFELKPAEYDEEHKMLWYGPIGPGEGCGWGRDGIAIMDPQTEAQAIAEIKKNFGNEFAFGPEVVTVDGLKMVRYSANGICSFHGIVVLGKRHAYGFSDCGDNRNDVYKEFNEIIATLKSI